VSDQANIVDIIIRMRAEGRPDAELAQRLEQMGAHATDVATAFDQLSNSNKSLADAMGRVREQSERAAAARRAEMQDAQEAVTSKVAQANAAREAIDKIDAAEKHAAEQSQQFAESQKSLAEAMAAVREESEKRSQTRNEGQVVRDNSAIAAAAEARAEGQAKAAIAATIDEKRKKAKASDENKEALAAEARELNKLAHEQDDEEKATKKNTEAKRAQNQALQGLSRVFPEVAGTIKAILSPLGAMLAMLGSGIALVLRSEQAWRAAELRIAAVKRANEVLNETQRTSAELMTAAAGNYDALVTSLTKYTTELDKATEAQNRLSAAIVANRQINVRSDDEILRRQLLEIDKTKSERVKDRIAEINAMPNKTEQQKRALRAGAEKYVDDRTEPESNKIIQRDKAIREAAARKEAQALADKTQDAERTEKAAEQARALAAKLASQAADMTPHISGLKEEEQSAKTMRDQYKNSTEESLKELEAKIVGLNELLHRNPTDAWLGLDDKEVGAWELPNVRQATGTATKVSREDIKKRRDALKEQAQGIRTSQREMDQLADDQETPTSATKIRERAEQKQKEIAAEAEAARQRAIQLEAEARKQRDEAGFLKGDRAGADVGQRRNNDNIELRRQVEAQRAAEKAEKEKAIDEAAKNFQGAALELQNAAGSVAAGNDAIKAFASNITKQMEDLRLYVRDQIT
jgi:hypothetical protein